MVKDFIPTYSKFFLLDPIGIAYETDEIRSEDEKERQKIHEDFLKFFEEKKIPFELLSGTLEKRIKRVEQTISKYLDTGR